MCKSHTKTFIREYFLGEKLVNETVGNSMQVFLLDIPRLEFAAIIPKGEFVTVVMLGDELDQELEANVTGPVDGGDPNLDETARQRIKTRGFRLDEVLREWEQRYINAALKLSNGNLSQAARLLGINRTTLYSRMQRLSGDRQVS